MPPRPLRADRLRRLFDQGHALTKVEAADRLGCTPRHVVRLVAELRGDGVPVRERRDGRAKRFYLAPEDQRRTLAVEALDEAALLALTVAAQASEAALAGTPLEAPLRRAFGPLLEALDAVHDGLGPDTFEPDTQSDGWHFGALAAQPVDPDLFALLRRARDARRSVRTDYTNGKGKPSFGRVLDPLALAPLGGAWQLVAFCHNREAVRDFNLARLAGTKLLSRTFDVPVGWSLRAHFRGRFGALQGSGPPVEVVLRVAAERATYFMSRRYHRTQTEEAISSGGLRVRYRVPEGALDAVRAFVASWGPHVVVEAPAVLATRIADDARAVAVSYASESYATAP